MPRGSKSKYSNKQERQADHIEKGYENRGVSKKEAKSRAWATVNKMTGGGKRSGSGRGRSRSTRLPRARVVALAPAAASLESVPADSC